MHLSKLLQLDEFICIDLLTRGTKASARTGRPALATAVLLFDEFLLERVACLKSLWAEIPDLLEEDHDFDERERVLGTWRVILYEERKQNDRSLLQPVLQQLLSLQQRIDQLLPGQKHSADTDLLPQDLKQFHLRALRRAQRDLVLVLYGMSRADCLTIQEVLDLLGWVRGRKVFDEVTVMMLA